MYVPAHFELGSGTSPAAFVDQHSFGMLVTPSRNAGAAPAIDHLPFLCQTSSEGELDLKAHVARANPVWRDLDGASEVTAVFRGPHVYISPRYYRTAPNVPTWNYAALHLTGSVTLMTTEETLAFVRDLTRHFEGAEHTVSQSALQDDYESRLARAIVGFTLRVRKIEGKMKLNQNRTPEDRAGVIDALHAHGSENARAIAEMMRNART